MKELPTSPLRPLSASAETFDELEEIRARLVRAQASEDQALRRLGEATQRAKENRAVLNKLLAEALATRRRAIEAYAEWNRAVERINEMSKQRKRDKHDP